MTGRRAKAACALAALGAAASAAPASAAVPHTVLRGETLWSVAAASNFTTRSLAAYNGLSPDAGVMAGQTLMIPTEGEAAGGLGAGAAPAAAGGGQAAPVADPVQPTNPTDPSLPPHPTSEVVTPGQVGAQASEHGVAPATAAGVARQESGFNNALVSPAGARGVMQIMPGTWRWIQGNLASYPLSPASASENVHAGVMYLRYLVGQTGDLPTALASYYQGLASVRRQGQFGETQRYVENVMANARRYGGP